MIHRYCFLVIVAFAVAQIVFLLLLLLLLHQYEHPRQVVVVNKLRLATLHTELASHLSLESRGCETVILRRAGLSIDLHSIASGQLLRLLQQPIEVFCQ
jgi:thiamine biosynthesis lipoprotein ApbE